MNGEVDPVFISYSHDSREHGERVLALSNRLRSVAIAAMVDQYVIAPPEGWPRWMQRQIQSARHVLVVCTETYYRRATLGAEEGVGLGTIWESQVITQEMYEAGGRNEKFLPVVFDEGDIPFIVPFLRPFTRFSIADDESYELLLRVLTDQPLHVPPPLGNPIVLPPAPNPTIEPQQPAIVRVSDSGDFALVHPLKDGFIGMTLQTLTEDRNEAICTLTNDGTIASAIRQLDRGDKIAIAYGNNAILGDLRELTIGREGVLEKATLRLSISRSDFGVFSEPNVNGTPADRIAEMRASRILLNQPGPVSEDAPFDINGTTMEVFIRGMNVPMQVTASPFPSMYNEQARADQRAFLEYARLVAVLLLKMSGAVEVVERLALTLDQSDNLTVDFVGRRARKYANQEPYQMRIQGSVNLA